MERTRTHWLKFFFGPGRRKDILVHRLRSSNQQNLVVWSTPGTADEVSWPLKLQLQALLVSVMHVPNTVSDDTGIVRYCSSSGNDSSTIFLPTALSRSWW